MSAAPEYLYGDFKIRRQCAFVDDPETLRVEVEVQGANHPLFWVRQTGQPGFHLLLSAWVPGLPNPVHRYAFFPKSSCMFACKDVALELRHQEAVRYAEFLREVAFAFERQAAAAAK
jgi:hypothetical protein